MRTLWEPTAKRGQCGKAAVRGLATGLLLACAIAVASLLGLF